MEKARDPGIRTRWAAALAAGRRPRLVAAACALVLAAPLVVVAVTGSAARQIAAKARGRKAWIHRNGGLRGMAGRKDCLVATPDRGSQQSA